VKKVRIGVVGTGDVALKLYLPTIVKIDPAKAEVTAMADADPERVQRAQSLFGGRYAFTDYRQLVECDEVDMVLNLTKHSMHTEINMAAIAAGKHVYSEKPLATTLADADLQVRSAQAAGVTLASAPAIVLDPQISMARQLYVDGKLGRMCFARVHGSHEGASLHGHFYDSAWYHKRSEGGGPLFDTGVYALHTITGVLGPAKRVVAFSGLCIPERYVGYVWKKDFQPYTMTSDVDDNVMMMLDWGDGLFGQVDISHCMLASQGPWAEFYGSKGVIASGAGEAPRNEGVPPFMLYQEHSEFGKRGWFKFYEDRGETRWTISYGVEHVVDAIREGRKPANSGEHARHVIEIIEKAVESAASGQVVDLTTSF
jgi:predicted dehydrogenase